MLTSILTFFKKFFKKSKEESALEILQLQKFLSYIAYKKYFQEFIIKNNRSERKLEILQANEYILSHYKTYNVEYLKTASLEELNRIDCLVKVRTKEFDAFLKILRVKFTKIKIEPIVVRKKQRGNILPYSKNFAIAQLQRLKIKLEKQQTNKKKKNKKTVVVEKVVEIPKKASEKKPEKTSKKTTEILEIECFICKKYKGTRSDLVRHMRENH